MEPLAYCEDRGDRLVVVNANTAKRNTLTPEYYRVLGDALDLATRESRITSVLLRGDGGFFCAGGDLRMLATRRELPRAERLGKIEDLHDLIRSIMACPKPVIAAIEGGAAGAGVSLAFACDLMVADADAKFTVAYVKAGLVPDGGLTSTLSAHLPRAMLMRMALLGEPVSARHLHTLGAISQIVAPGEVIATAEALAEALACGPSATHGVIKTLVNSARSNRLVEQMNDERDAMADAVAATEAAEGISAFLAKRAPDFKALRGRA